MRSSTRLSRFMELSVEYLRGRHAYWKERIAEAGIWDAGGFRAVDFAVRKAGKSYEGLFHRKYITSKTRLRMADGVNGRFYDRIILYRKSQDMSVREVDETLVHEMIHQYIIQNGIHDTSAHGRAFRDYMRRVNAAFPGELNITVRGKMPVTEGPGSKTHQLIVVSMYDGTSYCCRIMPAKLPQFLKLVRKNKKTGEFKDYMHCESDDMYFNSIRACRTRLHGLRLQLADLAAFCKKYNLRQM